MPTRRLPPRPFAGEVRKTDGSAIIDLHGEVDAFASDPLQRLFESAMSPRPTRIVFNFTDVDYVNSTGVALLVGLLAEGNRAGLTLVAFGLSEHYREIFDITRLSDFILVAEDEASALLAFADQAHTG